MAQPQSELWEGQVILVRGEYLDGDSCKLVASQQMNLRVALPDNLLHRLKPFFGVKLV